MITNDPREIVLEHPHLQRKGGTTERIRHVFHLGPDNNVERMLATGNVRITRRRGQSCTVLKISAQ